MLVLSRKVGESIVIGGNIIVKIVRLEGQVVKIGVEAPRNVSVDRREIHDDIQKGKRREPPPVS